jgi:hypothetical protein
MLHLRTAEEKSPATPDRHAGNVPELLEQLANEVTCEVCHEQISRFEMFVAWPVAGLVAHIGCAGFERTGGNS